MARGFQAEVPGVSLSNSEGLSLSGVRNIGKIGTTVPSSAEADLVKSYYK